MRHIADVLHEAVPQRWTAQELTDSIIKNGGRTTVKRVSSVLKNAASSRKIEVQRLIEGDRMVVRYVGTGIAFDEIRRRAQS